MTVNFVIPACEASRGYLKPRGRLTLFHSKRSKANYLLAFIYRMPFWFALVVFLLLAISVIDFATKVPNYKWWPDFFSICASILTGTVISFVFYYFVVFLPETRRRNIIKNSTIEMYRSIKYDILFAVVWASIKGGREDLTTDSGDIKSLMNPALFRERFEGGTQATEGFYAFENQMGRRTSEFDEIVLNIEFLAKQISFLLAEYSVEDESIFKLLKRIVLTLRLKNSEPGYEGSKPLCRFMWEIYAGFDFITGYRGYDIIEKTLA